jgi:hypothetical protein
MRIPGVDLADDIPYQLDEKELLLPEDYETLAEQGFERFRWPHTRRIVEAFWGRGQRDPLPPRHELGQEPRAPLRRNGPGERASRMSGKPRADNARRDKFPGG